MRQGAELGPAVLLANGNAMFFGGNGHTAIYNPTTNLWSAGPDEPTQPHSSTISGATNVSGTITGASNASPIVVTVPSTAGLSNGDLVTISGVTGNTAANGNWIVQGLTATSFQLKSSTGNGTYTGGGTWFDAIKITTASTAGLSNGQLVTIAGVGGNTAANGSWTITNLTGTTFQLVGPQGNGAYTSGGAWSTSQLSMDDAPGCMMANGHVLLDLSPLGGIGAGGGYTFPNPSYIYDFDPTTGIYTDVTPGGGISDNSDFLFMIALPSGQVLLDNQAGPGGFQIYSPAGLPSDSWRPVITGISNDGGGNFTLRGTQLTGISEGGSFGDEATMATNYPIIQFTDFSGNVLYGTTTGWNTAQVATGSTPESVHFTLPFGHSLSDFASVIVTANGIPSQPASIVTMGNSDENLYIRVDPNDSNTIEVWADGGFEVATFPNNSATPISVFGDTNNNQLVIDNSFGVVNTPITFDGGGSPGSPGDRMLVVGTTGNDTLTLTPTTPTTADASIDGSAVYSFTNIQNFAFYGATGDDKMIVDDSTSLLTVPIFYDGDNGYDFVAEGFGDPPTQGNGFNSLVITQSGGAAQTSDTYSVGPNVGEGSDVIGGGGNTQTIQFENLAPVQDNVPSLAVTINGTPAANAINYTQGPGGGIFVGSTGLVTVDNQESYEFNNKATVVINGLAGSDDINLNNPTTPAGLTGGITINGGDPTASDTLVVNGTTAQDTVNITPTAADGGTVAITGLPTITFATVENLIYNGQGGSDLLTITVPAGSLTTYTPGAASDAASVQINNLGPGAFTNLVPIAFTNLGVNGQSVQISAASTGATLIYNGTSADDTFSVSSLSGPTRGQVMLNQRISVDTNDFVISLVLNGLAGDDGFYLNGGLPYASVLVSGGDPSASDTVNLAGATGPVTVNLADSTLPSNTTITGYGSMVTLSGVEVANLNANSNTVSVVGTSQNDIFTYTPTGAAAGTFQNAGLNTVFNVSAVTGNLTVFGGSGGNADEVVVQGSAARDLFEINQGTAVATVLANNVTALLPVQLGTNVSVLTALRLGRRRHISSDSRTGHRCVPARQSAHQH